MKEKLKTYPALRRGVIGSSIGAAIMFLLAFWGILEGSSPPITSLLIPSMVFYMVLD